MELFTSNPELVPAINAQFNNLQNQQQAGTSRTPTATAYITKFSRDTSKHEKRQEALNKKTPIPKTGIQNIPSQFVLQYATTKQGQQDLQQSISTMRSGNEDTEYHITNNSEFIEENTSNESFTSSEHFTDISETTHRNSHIPTIRLNDDEKLYRWIHYDFNIPPLWRYYKDHYTLNDYGAHSPQNLPSLHTVQLMTPDKVFPDIETAIEYFQLFLTHPNIDKYPKYSTYCSEQLSYCREQLSMLKGRSQSETDSELCD